MIRIREGTNKERSDLEETGTKRTEVWLSQVCSKLVHYLMSSELMRLKWLIRKWWVIRTNIANKLKVIQYSKQQ